MHTHRVKAGIIAIGLLTASTALGWGSDGHRITAQIAVQRLSPQAKAAIDSMLGGKSLPEVANWADEIKSDRSYDWAKPLHYANVAAGATQFDLQRDCPEAGCVVSAIVKYTAILRDEKASTEARIEALKFLVHFVGDIHQPLHVARARDKGGNDIKVEFFYDRTNLHTVWDTLLIRRARKRWTNYARELSEAITQEQADRWRKVTDVSAWATETYQLALNYAYKVPKEGQIGKEYFDRCIPIVNEQLSVAGVRLAALLNSCLAAPTSAPAASAPACATSQPALTP